MFSLKRLAEHPSIRDTGARVRIWRPLSPRGFDFTLTIDNEVVENQGLRATRFVERGHETTPRLFAITAGVAAIWVWFIWTEMAAAQSMWRMGEWFVPAVLCLLAALAIVSAIVAIGRLRTRRELVIDWENRVVTVPSPAADATGAASTRWPRSRFGHTLSPYSRWRLTGLSMPPVGR